MDTSSRNKDDRISESDRQLLKDLLLKECKYQLDNETMDRFLDCGTVIDIPKGGSIIRAGKSDSNIYIIIHGIAARWRWSNDKESVDTFIPAGTLFCNYHSYYADEASHAFYDACTNVRVLRIPAHDYNDLIDNSHTFAKWCLSMAQCQQYTYELRDVRRSGTIKERYDVMQRTRPFILREVPLKTIAAYLGVVPQYLSTLRKEWLKDNGQDS